MTNTYMDYMTTGEQLPSMDYILWGILLRVLTGKVQLRYVMLSLSFADQ